VAFFGGVKVKILAGFGVVDAAVGAFLDCYEHLPATYRRDIWSDGHRVKYHLFPDDSRKDERLGIIEVRSAPGGATILEWGYPSFKERREPADERRAIWRAQQAAIKRHRPADFDAAVPEQWNALDERVKNDRAFCRAQLEIKMAINNDWLTKYDQYEERRQAIAAGLAAWLDDQGIKEATDAPPAPEVDVDNKRRRRDNGHYAYPLEKRREIARAFERARAAGEIDNIDAWARSIYQITGKTLTKYIRSFTTET
jgi:hypothetical protein